MSKGRAFLYCNKYEFALSVGFRLDMSEIPLLLLSKEGSNSEVIIIIVNICKGHVFISRYNGTKLNTKLLCNCLIRDYYYSEKILLNETNKGNRVLYK